MNLLSVTICLWKPAPKGERAKVSVDSHQSPDGNTRVVSQRQDKLQFSVQIRRSDQTFSALQVLQVKIIVLFDSQVLRKEDEEQRRTSRNPNSKPGVKMEMEEESCRLDMLLTKLSF